MVKKYTPEIKNPYLTKAVKVRATNNRENPKDSMARTKLPLDLVPDSMAALASLSFLEGALKYGQYNWRTRPVKMSVYSGAIKRHLAALMSGQWEDSKTKVPHISAIMANAAIIGDAKLCGTLIDDRPPESANFVEFLENPPDVLEHLEEIFGHIQPHQCTIKDEPEL